MTKTTDMPKKFKQLQASQTQDEAANAEEEAQFVEILEELDPEQTGVFDLDKFKQIK